MDCGEKQRLLMELNTAVKEWDVVVERLADIARDPASMDQFNVLDTEAARLQSHVTIAKEKYANHRQAHGC